MLRIASFTVDVTPPIGHALCAGLTKPSTSVRDPLHARGVILDDGRTRVVFCAVEFCEINGSGHRQLARALARGAGTLPRRVALHTVHQHDAPLVSPDIEPLLRQHGIPQLDPRWWAAVIKQVGTAAGTAVKQLQTVTHIGTGEARVAGGASNRRLLGRDGKVAAMRWAKNTEPALQAQPVGRIDPLLRTLTLWNDKQLLASLSFYATHPQSADGRGIISADSIGEALRLTRQRFPRAQHIYFTGGAGNITFGKYATGDPEKNIRLFGQRIAAGIANAIQHSATERVRPEPMRWRTLPVQLPFHSQWQPAGARKTLANPHERLGMRVISAAALHALTHRRQITRFVAQSLQLGPAWIVCLPNEVFVEYQLFAQALRPEEFVAIAAYGDTKMAYLPTAAAFAEGGYEVSPLACHTTPAIEPLLRQVITKLLAR